MPRKCWAFLVGVNEYLDYTNLRYCVDDVRSLASLLNQIGYVPICLHDLVDPRKQPFPTRTNIEVELEALLEKVTNDDLLLVYFACHGVRSPEGQPLLVVSETRKRKLADTAISIADYLEPRIRGSKAKQKVLMLDACFIGTGRGDRDPADYLRRVSELTRAFEILSASTEQQEALESSELKHGIFGHFVLQGLAGAARMGQDFVMLSMLRNYLRAEIDEYTARHGNVVQVPQHRSEGDAGDFMLVDYTTRDRPNLDTLILPEESNASSAAWQGRGDSLTNPRKFLSLSSQVIESLWSLNFSQQRQRFQEQIAALPGGAVIAVQAENPLLQLWLAKRLLRRLPEPEVNIYNKRCIISAKEAAKNFDLVWDEVWKWLNRESAYVPPYSSSQDVLNQIVETYQADRNIIIFVENWLSNVHPRRARESQAFINMLMDQFWQPLKQQIGVWQRFERNVTMCALKSAHREGFRGVL